MGRPFQPGQSGNPNGRPKKLPLTDVIREKLEAMKADGKVSNAEAIADKLIEMALGGSLEAMKELADRAEGKPKQRNELSGPDGGPIPLEVPGTRNEIERRIAELISKTKGE